jgi:hypothetical protein
MFNVGSLYRFCEVYRKHNREYRVTLIGKTDAQNKTLVVTDWGTIPDTDLANKIGYACEILKGGEYSFHVNIPGNDSLVARDVQGWAPTEQEAIEKARAALEERKQLLESLKDPATALDFELKHFDVYYAYSDDYRHWSAGNAAQKRIQALCDQLGKDFQIELNRVRPEIED